MDKSPAYAGQVPLDTLQFNQPQRNMEFALGFALKATFGTTTLVDGLACTPTSPASLSVNVGPGAMIFNTTVDTLVSGFASLPVDNTTPLVKIGINSALTILGPFTAPVTAGQSQNYLIQASFSETDGSPVPLPYYNPALPSVPFSGPNNTGAAQNTIRSQTVTLQVKAGVAATTGSQTTPAADAGNTGLWVVTLANGNTTITSGNITQVGAAPFIPAKLGPGMNPGFSNMRPFNASGSWLCPSGITKAKRRVWGAGGGGGGALNTGCAAIGGSAGGYHEDIITVVPGTTYTVTVGAAGTAGASLGGNGGTGGSSSFNGVGATGGGGGGGASAGIQTVGTGAVGVGSGGSSTALNLSGLPGTVGIVTGNVSLLMGGGGGPAPFFSALTGAVQGGGPAGSQPGAGGGGASAAAAGGAGAAGLVIVEW